MPDINVRFDDLRNRYTVSVDGQDAGFTRFLDRGVQRVFIHTEIEERFEGHGLASELIREALNATRDDGRRIIAVCPFVAAYVGKHHDFDDILDTLPEPPKAPL